MIVFKNKEWTVDKVEIAQGFGSKEEYFVDDTTGKNWVAFDSLEKAMEWINGEKWEEMMVTYYV